MVFLSRNHSKPVVAHTKTPTLSTPINWVINSAGPKMPTAKVPQIPATRCTGMAPTTSSIPHLSRTGMDKVASALPTAPTMTA